MKKVLDVRLPKKDQEKSSKLTKELKKMKYQITVKDRNKIRYMYGNDPSILESFAKAKGFKIVEVTEL